MSQKARMWSPLLAFLSWFSLPFSQTLPVCHSLPLSPFGIPQSPAFLSRAVPVNSEFPSGIQQPCPSEVLDAPCMDPVSFAFKRTHPIVKDNYICTHLISSFSLIFIYFYFLAGPGELNSGQDLYN